MVPNQYYNYNHRGCVCIAAHDTITKIIMGVYTLLHNHMILYIKALIAVVSLYEYEIVSRGDYVSKLSKIHSEQQLKKETLPLVVKHIYICILIVDSYIYVGTHKYTYTT